MKIIELLEQGVKDLHENNNTLHKNVECLLREKVVLQTKIKELEYELRTANETIKVLRNEK